MKKSTLLVLPLLMTSLMACTPTEPSTSQEYFGDYVKVYFFASATAGNKDQAWKMVEVIPGGLIPKPEGEPTANDPAFNTFKGWSKKPIVYNEKTDYWNFEEDHIPDYIPSYEFYLYGQWDYVA